MIEHAVAIAGGGPTGLTLAGELKLAGVDVAIVERRANQDLAGRRAGGLHSRTIEVLDQRGIAERFVAEGKPTQAAGFNMVRLDLSDFPTRHNYVLALQQNHIERILAGWIAELEVPIYREREVTGFAQDERGVEIALSHGERLRARYLVGCDGGRSLVRKAAGIEFAGWDPTTSWLIAEAEMRDEPPFGFRHDAVGVHAIGKIENGTAVGVVLTERRLPVDVSEPTLRDVSEALVAVYGTDFGIHSATLVSRFTDVTRQAAAYRERRVLLAGDAAHVHPPMGGQGLNLGVQDAMNLGWKLAQVVHRTAPEKLLDTYHTERHPVAARVLRTTMAQVALRRTDERTKALGDIVAELVKMDEPRKRLAAEMSGLDIRYNLGRADLDAAHPLLGRRMPDLELDTNAGPRRVFSLLHDARAVLVSFGEPAGVDVFGWTQRVRFIDARYAGAWDLPVIGSVGAPAAVLIRPDGYVAWVGVTGGWEGLADALRTWFGPPAAA
ncbi:MAG TPA: FAD-dependent monooxygenase [Gammaproteobacteria bacterium]|nr:FAD-dependent monooxygenase [Gammaproteobacteria bacterium]